MSEEREGIERRVAEGPEVAEEVRAAWLGAAWLGLLGLLAREVVDRLELVGEADGGGPTSPGAVSPYARRSAKVGRWRRSRDKGKG